MIYVTGDTHGFTDNARIDAAHWPVGQTLTRNDCLVICGDFGAFWGDDERDQALLDWYEAQPWTTLWVDGNHENHDLIDQLEVTERFGGQVQVAPGHPHVIHLMRGEVYVLPLESSDSSNRTVRCFVMGGAPSTDRIWRIEGISWWAREMPSQAEYDHAAQSLERVDWQVDYVFSHEVPEKAMSDIYGWTYWAKHGNKPSNELTGFLQYVDERLDKDRLKMWYAGHHHVDLPVIDEHHCVLYQQVLPLGALPAQE